jgi:hypothetical protein
MDMTKHVSRYLTDAMLRALGGRYVGVIADVTMERLNDKFRGRKVDEPVIRFADNVLLSPNQTMRKALIARFGGDTDGWRGKQIAIVRHVLGERTDVTTGEVVQRAEKRLDAVPVAAEELLVPSKDDERMLAAADIPWSGKRAL